MQFRMHSRIQSKATVKGDGDTVTIENVDRLSDWVTGYQNSYMESLAVAMDAIDETVSYEYLMGVSGAAFRLQIGQFPDWCGMPTDSGRGFDCIAAAWNALGYSFSRKDSGEFMGEGSKKNLPVIRQSIDSGCPVIAMDLEDDMCWGLVVGYSDAGEQLLCRTKTTRKNDYSRPKKWPWLVDVFSRKKKDTDREKLIAKSLKISVMLATQQFENFSCGFSGYEDWIKGLHNDDVVNSLNEKQTNRFFEGSAIYYYHLLDARTAATKYLFYILDSIDESQKAHVYSAANNYQEIYEKLLSIKSDVKYPWQLEGEKWTRDMRHAQADILEECLRIEREAISKIEKAVGST